MLKRYIFKIILILLSINLNITNYLWAGSGGGKSSLGERWGVVLRPGEISTTKAQSMDMVLDALAKGDKPELIKLKFKLEKFPDLQIMIGKILERLDKGESVALAEFKPAPKVLGAIPEPPEESADIPLPPSPPPDISELKSHEIKFKVVKGPGPGKGAQPKGTSGQPKVLGDLAAQAQQLALARAARQGQAGSQPKAKAAPKVEVLSESQKAALAMAARRAAAKAPAKTT